jgi:hypothetical protein
VAIGTVKLQLVTSGCCTVAAAGTGDHCEVSLAKRKGLIAKRNWLFTQFEANPSNIRTAQEIKKLDDEIAECNEHLTMEPSKNRLV